jgi:hypothetical protein
MDFSLEDRRAEIARHQENRARSAVTSAVYDFEGAGSIEFEEAVDFGLTYIEMPVVSTGVTIDMDTLRDAYDLDDAETPPIPTVTGFVTEWEQDTRGFYTGAWVAAAVAPAASEVTPVLDEVAMSIHFSFSAIAIKDIPLDERN